MSGQELALLTLITPYFLSTRPLFLPSSTKEQAFSGDPDSPPYIPTWYEMLTTKRGQVIAYLVQYSALVAFASKSPAVRLAVVAVSCAIGVQREVLLWAGLVKGQERKRGYWATVAVLGFAVAAGLKGANHTNNPSECCLDHQYGLKQES